MLLTWQFLYVTQGIISHPFFTYSLGNQESWRQYVGRCILFVLNLWRNLCGRRDDSREQRKALVLEMSNSRSNKSPQNCILARLLYPFFRCILFPSRAHIAFHLLIHDIHDRMAISYRKISASSWSIQLFCIHLWKPVSYLEKAAWAPHRKICMLCCCFDHRFYRHGMVQHCNSHRNSFHTHYIEYDSKPYEVLLLKKGAVPSRLSIPLQFHQPPAP